MHPLAAGLLYGLEKNHGYLRSLCGGIDDADLVAQPFSDGRKPMNHGAWILSHLGAYRSIVAALVSGAPFDDPLDHRFGMKSQPEPDRSVYGSLDAMLKTLETGKNEVESAIRGASDSIWAAPVPLARWQTRFGSMGAAVPFLLLCHENMHIGQFSAWRRAMGWPSVAM